MVPERLLTFGAAVKRAVPNSSRSNKWKYTSRFTSSLTMACPRLSSRRIGRFEVNAWAAAPSFTYCPAVTLPCCDPLALKTRARIVVEVFTGTGAVYKVEDTVGSVPSAV